MEQANYENLVFNTDRIIFGSDDTLFENGVAICIPIIQGFEALNR